MEKRGGGWWKKEGEYGTEGIKRPDSYSLPLQEN